MLNAAPTDLSGQTCLVTGANGGIGQAAVQQVLALGARVYATDIGKDFAGVDHSELSYQAFDLLDDNGLNACLDWVSKAQTTVLFNNATMFDMGNIWEADMTQNNRLFGLNVRSFYAVMQAAVKSMIAQKMMGSIINLASQAVKCREALVAHVCATKAAVISYTQSAVLALAPQTIRANAISSGVINTPTGYVARAAVFLTSDQSSYMTAQTIGVDGGNVLR